MSRSSTTGSVYTRPWATAPRPRRGPAWKGSTCARPRDVLIPPLHSSGGGPSWSSRRLRDGGASGRVEHPGAEQLESGATVHGALDRLQPADLTLAGTRRPPLRERGPDGREVLSEPLGEARERRPGRGREPLVQRSRSLLPYPSGEGRLARAPKDGRI